MTEPLVLRFHGAAADYIAYEGREALAESGAGTGKSFSVLAKADYVARTNPGSRQLFARQTRVSLNDTILPLWRDAVLGDKHPAIKPNSTIPFQHNYTYPNKSDIVVGGLEDADKVLSAEYDRIYIFQAEECSLEGYEKALTRLRHRHTPYHQITLDVNPASKFHWINRRWPPVEAGESQGRQRFCYRHEDNPTLFDHKKGEWSEWGREYVMEILGSLTGVRRQRLLNHLWVAEEGIILENWDPTRNMVSGECAYDEKRASWMIHQKGVLEPIPIAYFTAGVDWGWDPDPGVLQVWGYDSPRWHPGIRRFRVAEIYKTKLQKEEWADRAVDLWQKYDIRFFCCDRSRPDAIEYFNRRISHAMGREMPPIAVGQSSLGGARMKGSSEIREGIDLMREGILHPTTGHVRTLLMADAFPEGKDKNLLKRGRPTCMEEEVTEWVYQTLNENDPQKEPPPDKKCDDHALDAARYDECFNWLASLVSQPRRESTWKRGTYGESWVKTLKTSWNSLSRKQKQKLGRRHLPVQMTREVPPSA